MKTKKIFSNIDVYNGNMYKSFHLRSFEVQYLNPAIKHLQRSIKYMILTLEKVSSLVK